MDKGETEGTDISYQEVRDKYTTAAAVTNEAIQTVIESCVAGAKVHDLCVLGDQAVTAGLEKTAYTKEKKKGSAFPCCISLNHCIGHHSPLSTDKTTLAVGDVVKIDLGTHITGYASLAAHTIVVPPAEGFQEPVTGRIADVICATYFASEVVLRMIQPGKTNREVSETIAKVAKEFKCSAVIGVESSEIEQYSLEGKKVIQNHFKPEDLVKVRAFEENEVYVIDLVMSTGTGKGSEGDVRPHMFQKNHLQTQRPRTGGGKYLMSQVNRMHPTFPFTLKYMKDLKKARLGVLDCVKNNLITPLPVLWEKKGEFVSQFKFTVFCTNAATVRLNQFTPPYVSSDYSLTEELQSIMDLPLERESSVQDMEGVQEQQEQTGDTMEE